MGEEDQSSVSPTATLRGSVLQRAPSAPALALSFALRAALEKLMGIRDRERLSTGGRPNRLMAALTLLQSGPAVQRTPVAADISGLLRPLAEGGQLTYMQWVPSHCGLPGNERADVLAGEASALPQDSIPIDVSTIQKTHPEGCRASSYPHLAGRMA